MFRVGQLAINIDEGTTHQIRHIKIQNGEQMLGFGRKRFAWCFADIAAVLDEAQEPTND